MSNFTSLIVDIEDEELLAFVLDCTIGLWEAGLPIQQSILADNPEIARDNFLEVSGNLVDNLQRLKRIRGRLDA
jgi:hypothetical protein